MDDDELLRVLTRIARQDPTIDPRWRRLSEETLPEDERGALDTLATRSRSARDAREAFRPLDDEARVRLADSLISQLIDPSGDAPPPASLTRPARDRESGIRFRSSEAWGEDEDVVDEPERAPVVAQADSPASAQADSLSGTSVAPDDEQAELWADGAAGDEAAASSMGGAPAAGAASAISHGTDRVETISIRPTRTGAHIRSRKRAPDPRARARTAVTVVTWVAAAALVSLLALRPAPFAPGAAPLPSYALRASVGHRHAGGGAKLDDLHVTPGAHLSLTLTPEAPVLAPVAVKAFVAPGGGPLRPWIVELASDEAGVVRVSGAREALFPGLAAGALDVIFAIGQPGSLPATAEDAGEALRSPDRAASGGCRFVRRRFVLD